MNKNKLLLFGLSSVISGTTFAQKASRDISGALNTIEGQVKTLGSRAAIIILVVAGLVCLIGVIKAAGRFWNNEHDSVKGLVQWFGGCLLVIAGYIVLDQLFGLTW